MDQRCYQAKWELAPEMVAQARKNSGRFAWVGVDSLYGHNNKFLNALEDQGESFMADVRKNDKVWTQKPALEVPQKSPSQRGKAPTRLRLNKEKNRARSLTVEEFVGENFEKKHQVLSDRQGTKGKLCARVWVKEIWVWEGRWKGGPRKRR